MVCGIAAGAVAPEFLAPVAKGTAAAIRVLVLLVPALIFVALSPAIAALLRRGLAGRFAAAVLGWYLFSSLLAALFGLSLSSILFGLPLSIDDQHPWEEAKAMLASLGEGGASWPLLAIGLAVLAGLLGVRNQRVFSLLGFLEKGMRSAGRWLTIIMPPALFAFGISLSTKLGGAATLGYYLLVCVYTLGLCLLWWAFYVFVLLRLLTRQPLGPMLRQYYLPTALFAAGTCSSLATLPVNLLHARRSGVRDEVADFVIPFGAVCNMDASALAYMAYAPLILGVCPTGSQLSVSQVAAG